MTSKTGGVAPGSVQLYKTPIPLQGVDGESAGAPIIGECTRVLGLEIPGSTNIVLFEQRASIAPTCPYDIVSTKALCAAGISQLHDG